MCCNCNFSVVCAEAQQYRERIRKAKLHVYEQYLWRKDMMQDYKQQVEYMRSPAWDEIYSEKIERCGCCTTQWAACGHQHNCT